MTPGERFKQWIEGLAADWGDRLRGWMIKWAVGGITDALEDMEPEQRAAIDAIAQKLIDDENTPPQIKAFLRQITKKGNPLIIAAGVVLAVLMIVPIILSVAQPLANILTQKEERLVKSFRLDPLMVITAWRRDPTKYAWLFDDLKDQGWSAERIESLQFLTQFMPSPQDLVNWEAKEVFEPAMVAKYGLDDEFEGLDLSLFDKIGVSKEQALNYWRAHWQHASWIQVVEMVRRGQMTEPDVWDWFRLIEIPPFWRQKLINISWEVPTRVDVRRFWDMRTIDEARLREIYTNLGYHGKDLDDYVLWTKIYTDFPDLLARYKNGWITLDQVKNELIATGMKPDRVNTLIEEKIKKAAPERAAADKNLSLTDIYKGVKQGRITRSEATELITDLGYDEDEADFKLAVNIPTDQEDEVVAERQLTKADILSGLKAAVITRAEAAAKLLELRYSAANVDLLLKIFDAQVTPPTEATLKEVSKADIITAVKKGIITQEEGYLMLLDIGFDPEAALFILTVQTEESPFSPRNFDEFKDLTQKYRLAAGMSGKPITGEIKKLGAEVVRLSAVVEALRKSVKEEQGKLVGTEGLPEVATARLKELQVTLHKAEAELFRVKTDYDAKVAEWRIATK